MSERKNSLLCTSHASVRAAGKAVKPRGKVRSLLTSTLQSVINLLRGAARPPEELLFERDLQPGKCGRTKHPPQEFKSNNSLCGEGTCGSDVAQNEANLVQQVKPSERQNVTRSGVGGELVSF